MHNLRANFNKFLTIAKSVFRDEINAEGNFRFYPNKPKMTDIQIIALSCLAESLSIDRAANRSENWLFGKLRSEYSRLFPNLIHRTTYNRRRRRLSEKTAQLSKLICLKFSGHDTEYVIDSIPVPICQKPRIARLKICRDDELVLPSTAWHASHKSYYHGFKMHLIISKSGFPFAAGMTTASMHDSQYIPFLKHDNLPECELLADRGYISAGQQLALFQQAGVRIITPLKANMKIKSLWNYQRRKTRKIIETLFSQLCDQQLLKRNYAKTSEGLFARIVAKIASVSILKAINSLASKPLGRIKHTLFC
jgi:hypothetical protein